MTAIAPCPFCGGENTEVVSFYERATIDSGEYLKVICNDCMILGKRGYTTEGAIAEWNIRLSGTCKWTPCDQNTYPYYQTGCEKTWVFIDGGPEDNYFIYCPYCSGRIEVDK